MYLKNFLKLSLTVTLITINLSFNAYAEIPKSLYDGLNSLIPGVKPNSIEPSAIAGLYEVRYGSKIYYLNQDASLMVRGDIIDIKQRLNLTEKKRTLLHGKQLASLNENEMVIYQAKNEVAKVTIFTDIDCPYCVKLHQKMAAYNDKGITVRYLAYPRSGPGTASYNKAINVWCAKDKTQAMNAAKKGQLVSVAACDHPIDKHFKLAQSLGVRGTPSLYLEDGTNFPGYIPPEKLQKRLALIAKH